MSASEPPPLDSPEETDAPPREAALGRAAGSGFSWLSLSLIAGRGFSFVAQLVLGAILLEDEFGIFAIALSVAAFVQCFRDGGVQKILVQQGQNGFARLAAPAFWIGMWFSIAAGVVLAAGAPLAANFYGEPGLEKLLWVIACSLPLGTPAMILIAKLQIDLRFKTFAKISVVSMFLRHASAICFALLGFGAMSFVLPLILVAIYEGVAAYAATKTSPWRGGQHFDLWPELLSNSVWVTANAFLRGFASNGDYLVLGKLIGASLLGQYYFGFQITMQMHILLVTNFTGVLFPIFSRLADEPARQANIMRRSLSSFVIVSTVLNFAVAVGIAPLETLAWGGKWAPAVPLMQIFAFSLPFRSTGGLVHTVLPARGQFRLDTLVTALQALVLIGSASISYLLFGPSITKIALGICSVQLFLNSSLSIWIFKSFGFSFRQWLACVLPPLVTGGAIAAGCLLLDRSVQDSLSPLPRLLLSLGCFALLYGVTLRLLLSRQLRDLLSIMPERISRVLAPLLWLS